MDRVHFPLDKYLWIYFKKQPPVHKWYWKLSGFMQGQQNVRGQNFASHIGQNLAGHRSILNPAPQWGEKQNKTWQARQPRLREPTPCNSHFLSHALKLQDVHVLCGKMQKWQLLQHWSLENLGNTLMNKGQKLHCPPTMYITYVWPICLLTLSKLDFTIIKYMLHI